MPRGGVALGVAALTWLAVAPAVAQAPGPGPTVVATIDNEFFPKSLTVPPNTTVNWENRGLLHNVKFEDGQFEQPADPASTPWRVGRHFDSPGVFRYYCEAHGGPGGVGMSGVVRVEIGAAPKLTGLRITPKRVCNRRKKRCKTTARIRFTLSEAARVAGGLDPVGKPAGRHGRDLDFKGRQGANSFRVSARGLKPGRYRVTLSAEDADGNESDAAKASFTVRRARRPRR